MSYHNLMVIHECFFHHVYCLSYCIVLEVVWFVHSSTYAALLFQFYSSGSKTRVLPSRAVQK